LVVFYGATICFPMISRKPGCHILLKFFSKDCSRVHNSKLTFVLWYTEINLLATTLYFTCLFPGYRRCERCRQSLGWWVTDTA